MRKARRERRELRIENGELRKKTQRPRSTHLLILNSQFSILHSPRHGAAPECRTRIDGSRRLN
jgi:hypothetical protein